MLVKLKQLPNAFSFIMVTELGITILIRLKQAQNALPAILVTLYVFVPSLMVDGIVTSVPRSPVYPVMTASWSAI